MELQGLVKPVSKGEIVPIENTEKEVVQESKSVSAKSELDALTLEMKKLEIAEKKANLEDINERLDERKMKRLNIRQTSITNGQTLVALAKSQKQVEDRCNHRKGGNSMEDVKSGQGTSLYYAFMKHRMLNGDIWIRCLRCGKTWKPPVKSRFVVDGVLNESKYKAAWEEYEAAKMLPTNNSMSSSYAFAFSDGGEYFREVTAATNLR